MTYSLKETACLRCGSEEIVAGMICGGGDLFFNPGHIKWYKQFLLRQGVEAIRVARCCLRCGLVWNGLNTMYLKKFVNARCEDEFAYRLYGLEDGGNPNSATDCLNCGLKRKIHGKLFSATSDGSNYSLAFKPEHIKKFKFIIKFVDLDKTSECCAHCGFVFTQLDQKKLGEFILKNCAPEYVAQVYSYEEKPKREQGLS